MNYNYSNGNALLDVSPLPGASPTSFLCGNLLWKHFFQIAKNTETKKLPPTPSNENMVFSKQDYTQLQTFACTGQIGKLADLVERCSLEEINKQDHNGNTALIWATTEENEDVVKLLVESRAFVNVQNFIGETALFNSVSRGNFGMTAYLLENGANPNIANLDGTTPLHMSVASGNLEIMKLLCNYGAFINAQDDRGDTPLHYAVRENQIHAVELLVKSCGANVTVQNDDLETPLELASCLECIELVRLLSHYSSVPWAMIEEKEDVKHGGNLDYFPVQGNFEW